MRKTKAYAICDLSKESDMAKVSANTDPFFDSALWFLLRNQKCRTRAEALRSAIVIAARAKGWEGPKNHAEHDARWMDREEKARRFA